MTLRIKPSELVEEAEASGRPGLLARAPHWTRTPVGDIARVVNGAPFKSSMFNSDGRGMPLIRIRDVGKSTTNTYYDGPYDHIHVVRPGDILIGMDGDFRVARWQGPEALLNQRVCKLLVDEGLYDSRLLVLVIQGYLDAIWSATSSLTVKHLSSRSILDIPLPEPPLEEQQRIVTLLEDHLSRLDAGEGYLRPCRRRVGRLETAWLQSSRSIGEAERVALGDLLEIPLANGRSVPTQEGGFPVLRLTALREGRIELSEQKEGRWTRSEAAPFLVQSGDFLVARGNGSLSLVARGGLVGSVEREVAYPDTMIRVRPHRRHLDPDYLALIWDAPSTRAQLESMARTTAGIYKVNQAHLRSVMLPLPPLDEQRRLADSADGLRRVWSRSAVAVDRALEQSRGLRRSLLKAAFSGRLTSSAEVLGRQGELAGV